MSRTPEEQKVLDATAAALAAGGDPFGDDEELVRPGAGGGEGDDADDSSATDTAAAADNEGEGNPAATGEGDKTTKPADELDAAALEDIANPATEAPTRFTAEPPKDYKAQRTTLMTEKAQAMKRLMDGEIDAEQFAVEDTRIADALEDLTAQRIRAETLQEANVQNDAAYQQREIKKLISRTKAEVDYNADPKAPKQFDQALTMIQADPDNAGRDYADLIDEAHRTVAALRGVQAKAKPTTTPTPAVEPGKKEVPNRQPEGETPITLRNMPAASTPNTGGNAIDAMARLDGPEYEAAYARLTPQQKRTLLDD